MSHIPEEIENWPFKQARCSHNLILPTSLEDCKKQPHETQKEIYKLLLAAWTHWRAELLEKKKLLEENNDRKGSKAIQRIILAENKANMFAKICNCRGNKKSGLLTLEVPKDLLERDYKACKKWVSINVPKEIEKQLCKHKRDHFGQAKGSFPTIPQFLEWVDWGASTHQAELILEG